MAKSPNQKLKLLYLMRLFLERTDEAHPVTVPELIAALGQYGISAERKSLYDDFEALRHFGLDIVQNGGKYYVGSRDFELPELKLLVDIVQSSKFITEKKTLSLIKKLEGLASVHDARRLQREVYVRNRVKSMNESVYYNVDEISGAIQQDRAIRFRYFEYTPRKERRFRRDGRFYEASPYALLCDDENYYLLAWDDAAKQMKHYRVDKMTAISPKRTARQGKEAFQALDMSAYGKSVFGMFGGAAQQVRIRFADHLAGAVIDRFGKEVVLAVEDETHFIATLPVVVSPQFFGWVVGFGAEAEVLSPPDVRQELYDYLQKTASLYETQ